MAKKIDHGAAVAAEHGLKRSEHWPSLEKWMKKYFGNACQICGKGPVQIHHAYPFHDAILSGRPELELTFENLTSLCETEKGKPTQDDHLIVGHLENFRSFNKELLVMIPKWKGLPSNAIKEMDDWKTLAGSKPLSYPQMGTSDQESFKETLDSIFPKDKISVWNGKQFLRNGAIVVPSHL